MLVIDWGIFNSGAFLIVLVGAIAALFLWFNSGNEKTKEGD
jgi:hypothetical protein